jgi:hypothetical protein
VATAALFVLVGVGLASILSPLVGSALATAGQIVNVSDPSAPYTAKVTSSGELKTNGVVSGKVAPALPPQPFYVARSILRGSDTTVLGPTTATVALTDLVFANYFANDARALGVFEVSAPAPNSNCSPLPRERTLGVYDVASGETLPINFETPVVLKPLASGDAWCLVGYLVGPPADVDNPVSLSLGGYVLSGTFTPPAMGPESAKLGRTMRRR